MRVGYSFSLLISLLMGASGIVLGQKFACDGSMYYVATDQSDVSHLYRIAIEENGQSFGTREVRLDTSQKRHITAIGYNVRDQFIYGLDFNTYELLQIRQNGEVNSFGIPENLDTSFVYYAGEMTADGKSLLVIAHNKNLGVDERIYSIPINNQPYPYAGYLSIVSDLPVAMADITVDPYVGTLYAFDNLNAQVVETSQSGFTSGTHRKFEQVEPRFGALFFDIKGQMYGLGGTGSIQNRLYHIDKVTGSTNDLDESSGGQDSDGCGCPFTIEILKTITPDTIYECGTVYIEYNVINRAGIGQVGVSMEDLLPPEFEITSITIPSSLSATIKSGVNSNYLLIDPWTLIMGENRIQVEAEINSLPESILSSQAYLRKLNAALGPTITSDNPSTLSHHDPTVVWIESVDKVGIDDHITFSCDNDTAWIHLPLGGTYQWDDGSTSERRPVVHEGEYFVEVTNDCFVYTDTFTFVKQSDLLSALIDGDSIYQLGDLVNLRALSNTRSIKSIRWDSYEDFDFSCIDCINTSFIASRSGEVNLLVTDTRGCTAEATLKLRVKDKKKIFAPNIFTPNGDGINDYFQIYGKNIKVQNLQIFNRWGNLLFNDIHHDEIGWNGMHNGRRAETGTYLWTAEIIFADGSTLKFGGAVVVSD